MDDQQSCDHHTRFATTSWGAQVYCVPCKARETLVLGFYATNVYVYTTVMVYIDYKTDEVSSVGADTTRTCQNKGRRVLFNGTSVEVTDTNIYLNDNDDDTTVSCVPEYPFFLFGFCDKKIPMKF